jgi:hypothetical protein
MLLECFSCILNEQEYLNLEYTPHLIRAGGSGVPLALICVYSLSTSHLCLLTSCS